jgi:NADPH:quinone reductase-like Zn-dependent oxidoreductase
VVEAVGKDVTLFKPGDEVFGGRSGALSEYVCTTGKSLALKPANISFEQAASIPVAGCTALQGLRDKGLLQAGQKVLINGAAGGVGTFTVQIAKAFGAEVTGVCSTRNVEMVRSIGADQVIDYTKENFTRRDERYDLMLDNVGSHSISDCLRVLTPKGSYVMVGGSGGGLLGPMAGMIQTALISRFVSQKVLMFLATLNKEDLTVLKELVEAGKLTPVVDRCYPLTETAEAIRYIEGGHARGKVVVTVA